jgi:hypothetical protein
LRPIIKKDGLEMPVVFLTMHRRGVCLDGAPGRSGGLCPQACSQELVQALRVPLDGGTFVSPSIAGGLFQATMAKSREIDEAPSRCRCARATSATSNKKSWRR